MASNKVSMSHNHGYTLTVEAIQNSQNITANTSNVTINLKLTSTNKSFAQYAYSSYLYLDGTVKASHDDTTTNLSIGLNSTITLLTWTGNVSHNNDGKKSITVRGTAVIPRSGNSTSYSPGSGDVSVTLNLTDIARASSFTVNSTAVTLGNSFGITVTPNASYSHYITVTANGRTLYSETKTAISASTTYTISTSTSWGQYISTAMSATATISVQTRSGNTNIGSAATRTITLNVPSYTLSSYMSRSVSSLKSTYGYYADISSLGWTVSGTPPYGATISSVTTVINGTNVSGTSVSPILLKRTGNFTLTTTVTDSRGKTAVISDFTYTVERHTPLKINSVNTSRSGTTVTVTVSGYFTTYGLNTSNKPKNTLSSTVCTLGTTTLTSAYSTSYTTSGSFTVVFRFTNISTDSTYNGSVSIQETIYPQGNPVTYTFVLPTVDIPLDLHYSGSGVAIGKVSETRGILDVGYDTEFEGDVNVKGKFTVGGSEFKDYVTESGTSGIWTYRKWKSGVAECWGKSNYTLTTVSGSGWSDIVLQTAAISLPSIFIDTPVSVSTTIPWYYSEWETAWIESKTKITVRIFGNGNFGNVKTLDIGCFVIGKWK